MARYTYEPLEPDNFRILLLSPGGFNDPLQGSLEIYSMAEPPEYAAISYTWGEALFPYRLHLTGGHLQITRSLHGALRSFRRRDVPVRLWADQVCIAQYDLTEKNLQVESMADIYTEAEEVLVWLGEARESDCLARWTLQFLTEFHKNDEVHSEEMAIINPRDILELPTAFDAYKAAMTHEIQLLPNCSVVNLGALTFERALHSLTESIWSRSWFERLWVVQEVAVAQTRTLRFGHHSFDVQYLDDAASAHFEAARFGLVVLDRPTMHLLERCKRVTSLAHDYQEDSTQQSQQLLGALVDTHGLIAKEDHDRIYAVRALARIETAEELKPNYKIAPSDLWILATVVMLTALSDWELLPHVACEPPALCLALAGTQSLSTAPSWVLNVNHFTEQSFKTRNTYVQGARYVWAGSKLPLEVAHHSISPELLRLRGTFVCRVLKICSASLRQARIVDNDQHRVLEDVVALSTGLTNQYVAYYRFVCQEWSTERTGLHRADFWKLMAQGEQSYEEPSELIWGQCGEPIALTKVTKDQAFLESIEDAVPTNGIDCTRVLASTSTGNFGWIPNRSQPGDVICLFQGAPYPFVVRQRDDGFFALVGDAYVQGIMHGEAWPENIDGTHMIGLK